MSGLYKKALEIHRKKPHLRLVRADELQPEEEDEGISPEEREKILSQIEEVVQGSKIQISPATFSYTAKRSGLFMPIVVNIAIVAAVLGGLLLASGYFNRKEDSIVSQTSALLSAESKLIKALKKESEQQLDQKDKEISEIQGRLVTMNRQREQLESEFEQRLQEKEKQLKDSLESELQAEREKLQNQGVATETVEQRLREIEKEKQAQFEIELEAMKKENQDALAQEVATITTLMAEYEQSLEQAQRERVSLQEELIEQQARLEKQFLEREQALESGRSQALDELTSMREKLQKEKLISDQILSSYDKINGHLRGSQYQEALNNLNALKAFLGQESLLSLPAIQKRRPVELFIIRSLEELIAGKLSTEQRDTSSLIESSNLITAVAALVEQGDSHFGEGNLPAARKSYDTAMQQIPSVQQGYTKLNEMQDLSEQQESRKLRAFVVEADSLYLIKDFQPSIDRYKSALEYLNVDAEISNQMMDRAIDAGYQLRSAGLLEEIGGLQNQIGSFRNDIGDLQSEIEALEERRKQREAMLERLELIRRRYTAVSGQRAEGSTEYSDELLSTLFEAKILVKQILSSDPVRSQHPDLYDAMMQYFEVYGERNRTTGAELALQDVIELIALLESPEEAGSLTVWEKYSGKLDDDLVLQLLDIIQSLME